MLSVSFLGPASVRQKAFDGLKQALGSALIVQVPDFNKTFTMRIYASSEGLGLLYFDMLMKAEDSRMSVSAVPQIGVPALIFAVKR